MQNFQYQSFVSKDVITVYSAAVQQRGPLHWKVRCLNWFPKSVRNNEVPFYKKKNNNAECFSFLSSQEQLQSKKKINNSG